VEERLNKSAVAAAAVQADVEPMPAMRREELRAEIMERTRLEMWRKVSSSERRQQNTGIVLGGVSNMQTVDVRADGNCFFRAAALALYGDEDAKDQDNNYRHREIRERACDELLKIAREQYQFALWSPLKQMTTEQLGAYFCSAHDVQTSQLAPFAEFPIILSTARALNLGIVVRVGTGTYSERYNTAPGRANLFVHLTGNHYKLLVPGAFKGESVNGNEHACLD
jgi:hypothetical protein